jgi:hypothetical protein
MALEEAPNLGRRSLLAALTGAAAALVGHAVTAPSRALAADHDPLKIGEGNVGGTITRLDSATAHAFQATSAVGDGLRGGTSAPTSVSGCYGYSSHAAGHGVFGRNSAIGNTGYVGGPEDGVRGTCVKPGFAGVRGTTSQASGVGVYGDNTATGNAGYVGGPDDGVRGTCVKPGFAGVRGLSASGAVIGVSGVNTALGTSGHLGGRAGVIGVAPTDGFALLADGKVELSRSGVVTVAVGKKTAKVSSIALTDGSFVLATMQYPRSGVYIAAAVPNVDTDSITIYLNKAVTYATRVAWMVLDQAMMVGP